MLRTLSKITTGILTLVVAFMVITTPVSAQANCTEFYGIPDPICTEETPFAVGSIVIDDVTMLVLLAVFLMVMAVVLNALVIKGKVNSIVG